MTERNNYPIGKGELEIQPVEQYKSNFVYFTADSTKKHTRGTDDKNPYRESKQLAWKHVRPATSGQTER